MIPRSSCRPAPAQARPGSWSTGWSNSSAATTRSCATSWRSPSPRRRAGELRARIRTALSKARGGAADAAERRRLDDALRQVDAAHIETIHAFASSLLKGRPFDAGIDPGFEILDALGADLDFTDAWHGWLWREEDPRAQAAIERALRFDMPLDRLREAAQQLSRNRDLDPPRGSPPPPDPHETHAEWLQTAEQLRVEYEQLGSKQAAQPETLVGWLREMPLDDPDELSRLLLTPARTRKPTGRSEALGRTQRALG